MTVMQQEQSYPKWIHEDDRTMWDDIPAHMQAGVERYIQHGIKPGKFLQAVMENNLVDALAQADLTNRQHLHAYSRLLYNCLPSRNANETPWGSPESVAAWIKLGGFEGQNNIGIEAAE